MGRMGSTTSVRAGQMRRELADWQRSGSTLREFGEQRGIPPSTLTSWRRVFRSAGEEEVNGGAAEKAVGFTEVPPAAKLARNPAVLEIVVDSRHLVRVPAGFDSDTTAGSPGPADDILTLPASVRVFVARGATDLRRSFDRLSAQVQEVLRQDPLSGHVFVFFNRQRDRVKMLVWERDGFWLLYKRLEAGSFAALERDEINARELYLLLEGIEVVRERRRYTGLPIGG